MALHCPLSEVLDEQHKHKQGPPLWYEIREYTHSPARTKLAGQLRGFEATFNGEEQSRKEEKEVISTRGDRRWKRNWLKKPRRDDLVWR